MKQKILLADDSPTIRRLVTQTFVDGKFEVVAVSNGDAAIKALEEVRPSIVLADIYMPGKNGYEVCAYVRNHATLSATPVVLLVGAFDAFDEQVAARSGATANITKPFEPGALIELVRSLVSAQEEVKEARAVELVKPVEPPQAARPQETKPVSANVRTEVPPPAAAQAGVSGESDDLLGLETIFKEEP